MTEDQAKETWCPYGRLLVPWVREYQGQGHHVGRTDLQNAAINRNADGSPATLCLGSRCGLWLWEDAQHANGRCGLRALSL